MFEFKVDYSNSLDSPNLRTFMVKFNLYYRCGKGFSRGGRQGRREKTR